MKEFKQQKSKCIGPISDCVAKHMIHTASEESKGENMARY